MCSCVCVCVSLKQHVVAAKKKSEHTMFSLLNNNVIEKFKSVIPKVWPSASFWVLKVCRLSVWSVKNLQLLSLKLKCSEFPE